MSNFLVCRAHIDVLVSACAHYRPTSPPGSPHRVEHGRATGPEVLAETGLVLWEANHHALDPANTKDSTNTQPARPLPRYVPPTTAEPVEPMAVLKAIDCYVHQSSTTRGWADSTAAEITDRLREAILASHPELADYRAHWLYTRLPRHFTNLEHAHRRLHRPATPPNPTSA